MDQMTAYEKYLVRMNKKIKIVDPPSGWRYGFPKPMPEDLNSEEEIKKWFLDNGYPQDLITAGMLEHCRTWYTTK